jgi:hypothetical protein
MRPSARTPITQAAVGLTRDRAELPAFAGSNFLEHIDLCSTASESTGRGMGGIVRPSQISRKKARQSGHHNGHQNRCFVDTMVDTMEISH